MYVYVKNKLRTKERGKAKQHMVVLVGLHVYPGQQSLQPTEGYRRY